MSSLSKFKPLVNRICLNPEQAVLQCTCNTYASPYGDYYTATPTGAFTLSICSPDPRGRLQVNYTPGRGTKYMITKWGASS